MKKQTEEVFQKRKVLKQFKLNLCLYNSLFRLSVFLSPERVYAPRESYDISEKEKAYGCGRRISDFRKGTSWMWKKNLKFQKGYFISEINGCHGPQEYGASAIHRATSVKLK